jgi:hypothetical protein
VHHALVGAGRQQRIPLQRGRDLAQTYFDRLPALRVLCGVAGGRFGSVDQQVDAAVGEVDQDLSPSRARPTEIALPDTLRFTLIRRPPQGIISA